MRVRVSNACVFEMNEYASRGLLSKVDFRHVPQSTNNRKDDSDE